MKMIQATKLLGERWMRKWIPKYFQQLSVVGETRHHGNPLINVNITESRIITRLYSFRGQKC